MHTDINRDKYRINHWTYFISLVFFIKFLVFCIDPLPMFYLGDSHSYLSTAVTGWIPLDRSFLYGFVIRFIALSSHSLTSLIAVQVFTSALNSICIAYMLQKFFSVRPPIAFGSGLLCALEPLQLMYERYVLTESLSLFLFVIYIFLVLHYLRHPRLSLLAAIQFTGTALIGFRLSFLVIVIVNAFLLPVLAIPAFRRRTAQREAFGTTAGNRMILNRKLIQAVAIHLVLSLGSTYLLHLGYRQVNGMLSHRPPAYQYQSGIFLLSYLGPIVRPSDFPYTSLTENIFGKLRFDLGDRHKRSENHWQPGGVISNLNETIQDVVEADHAAGVTAFNAIKRDPLGLLRLGVSGFLDYWNLAILKCNIQSDRGDRPLPPEMLQTLSVQFTLAAENLPFLETVTNRYFLHAWPWYLFLIGSPLYCIAAFLLCRGENMRYLLVVVIALTAITFQACVLIEGPTVRYIHAAGWLIFLVATPILENLYSRYEHSGGG